MGVCLQAISGGGGIGHADMGVYLQAIYVYIHRDEQARCTWSFPSNSRAGVSSVWRVTSISTYEDEGKKDTGHLAGGGRDSAHALAQLLTLLAEDIPR